MKHFTLLLLTSMLALLAPLTHAASSGNSTPQNSTGANNPTEVPVILPFQLGDKLNNPKLYVNVQPPPTQQKGIKARLVIAAKNELRLYFVDHNNKVIEPPFKTVKVVYQRRINLGGPLAQSSYWVILKRSGAEPALGAQTSASTLNDLFNIQLTYMEAASPTVPAENSAAPAPKKGRSNRK